MSLTERLQLFLYKTRRHLKSTIKMLPLTVKSTAAVSLILLLKLDRERILESYQEYYCFPDEQFYFDQ